MKTISKLIGALGVAAGLWSAQPALAAIKCWTNSEGVRECGNVIPPEYAQQGSRTINSRGITTDIQGRAKTGAEFEAEQQRKAEEEARIEAQKKADEERIRQDNVLLATFASEQDIVMARNRKVTALEGTIEFTNASLNKLQAKLDQNRKRAANIERAGNPLPKELVGEMETVQGQIDSKKEYIATKRTEIEALRVEYETYLARYRQLMQQR